MAAAKAPLESRIAQALQGGAGSETLSGLIVEAQAQAEDLALTRDALRDTALNPATAPDAVRRARDALDDATFQAERLSVAVSRLREAQAEAQAREEDALRAQEYALALEERDAIAEELRTAYPDAARRIADILSRVVASNERLAAVNRARPDGAAHIETVEHHVRRVTDAGSVETSPGVVSVSQTPALVKAVRLPALAGIDAARGESFWRGGETAALRIGVARSA